MEHNFLLAIGIVVFFFPLWQFRARIYCSGALGLSSRVGRNTECSSHLDGYPPTYSSAQTFCNTAVATDKPLMCMYKEGNNNPPKFNVYCKVGKNMSIKSMDIVGKPIDSTKPKNQSNNCYVFSIRSNNVYCYSGTEFSCIGNDLAGATKTNRFLVNIPGTKQMKQKIFSQTHFYIGTKENTTVTNKSFIRGALGQLTCYCKDCSAPVVDISKPGYPEVSNDKKGEYTIVELVNITESHAGTYVCKSSPDGLTACPVIKSLNVIVEECKPGHYCLANWSTIIPCDAGTYNNKTGIFGKKGCLNCPIGHYCPKASINPVPCNHTSFQMVNPSQLPLTPAATEEDCRRCPLEKSCSNGTECRLLCVERQNLDVTAGQNVELRCRTSLDLKDIQPKWTKNGKVIDLLADNRLKIYRRVRFISLFISSVKEEDNGQYQCEGHFPGYQKKENSQIRLTVLGKQFTPIIVTVLLSLLMILVLALCFSTKAGRKFINSFKGGGTKKHCPEEAENRNYYSFTDYAFECKDMTPHPMSSDASNFDAFVCFSSKDREWVLKELLPELESKHVKLCIHYRDFRAGDLVVENIVEAIYNSRKTIAVLSPDFLQSEWCNYELQHAVGKMGNHIIPLIFRKCIVPNILNHTTYLDWTDKTLRPFFWDRLLESICL